MLKKYFQKLIRSLLAKDTKKLMVQERRIEKEIEKVKGTRQVIKKKDLPAEGLNKKPKYVKV